MAMQANAHIAPGIDIQPVEAAPVDARACPASGFG